MNLADAIRRAAMASGVPSSPPQEEAFFAAPSTPVSPVPEPVASAQPVPLETPTDPAPVSEAVEPVSTPKPSHAKAEHKPKPRLEPDIAQVVTSFKSDEGEPVRMPDPPGPPVAGGSVVRLELFLSPEQLMSLFRTIVTTHHTVMTSREAAAFLRIAPAVLEQLAESHEIPAFQMDGKWRFSRASLDEWLSMRASERRAS